MTTGSVNTASGHEALLSNTTGAGNTAHGAGALRANTTGSYNVAHGHNALRFNITGNGNTASGKEALRHNTVGSFNTASGYHALVNNTTASANTACGSEALLSNTTGEDNTACGYRALNSNTTGIRNTAIGYRALGGNTSGHFNTAIGDRAGFLWTTGSDKIAIGNNGVAGESATIRIGTSGGLGPQTRAFIAGIRGATTGEANAIPVLIDGDGQLGTLSSSRRFKQEIRDMGDLTERLLELRPVVFRYKQEQTMPDGSEVPLEYGLIAEEVAEVFPDLVVYDDEGEPSTVKYHLLASMLLNELKRLDGTHAREIEELRDEFETRFAAIESRTPGIALPTVVPARIR